MARVVLNRRLVPEVERTVAYRAYLHDKAGDVIENAKRVAPVRTGKYRDGLKVIEQGGKVYASGTDFKSGWIEFGTVNTPVFAPLRKGARAAGLRLDEAK